MWEERFDRLAAEGQAGRGARRVGLDFELRQGVHVRGEEERGPFIAEGGGGDRE